MWEAACRRLLSDEHFSMDGTLVEAQASIKNFRRRDDQEGSRDDDSGNPWLSFRRERLRNETHRSGTDPEARSMGKGQGQAAIHGPRAHEDRGMPQVVKAFKPA